MASCSCFTIETLDYVHRSNFLRTLLLFLATQHCLTVVSSQPCPEGTELPALGCDFETGLCLYTSDVTPPFHWERKSGPYGFRGVSSDHTTGQGYYMVTTPDRFGALQGGRAVLASLPSDVATAACVSIHYIMPYSRSRLILAIGNVTSRRVEVDREGEHMAHWHHLQFSTCLSDEAQIFISGIRDGIYSYIGLDDIKVTCGPCRHHAQEVDRNDTGGGHCNCETIARLPCLNGSDFAQTPPTEDTVTPVSMETVPPRTVDSCEGQACGAELAFLGCDFEAGQCGFTSDVTTPFHWERKSGPYGFQGVSSDHTTGQGHYMVTTPAKTGAFRGGQTLLTSKINVTTAACISLHYIIPTARTSLSVGVRTQGSEVIGVFRLEGKMAEWKSVSFSACLYNNSEIFIKGYRSYIYSYIGLDDVRVTCGPCTSHLCTSDTLNSSACIKARAFKLSCKEKALKASTQMSSGSSSPSASPGPSPFLGLSRQVGFFSSIEVYAIVGSVSAIGLIAIVAMTVHYVTHRHKNEARLTHTEDASKDVTSSQTTPVQTASTDSVSTYL